MCFYYPDIFPNAPWYVCDPSPCPHWFNGVLLPKNLKTPYVSLTRIDDVLDDEWVHDFYRAFDLYNPDLDPYYYARYIPSPLSITELELF